MESLLVSARFFFQFINPALLVLVYVLKTYYFPGSALLYNTYVIILSSIVGYYTNFIAIKMLFRPKKVTVFGRQGLIPHNQDHIAESFGKNIAANFFTPEYILDYLDRRAIVDTGITNIKDFLEAYLVETVRDGPIGKCIALSLDLAGNELNKFMQSKSFNEFIERVLSHVLEEFDIASLVTERIKSYDTDKLETMLLDLAGKHLVSIEVIGGLLGAFTGIAIFNCRLFLLLFSCLLLLGGVEYALTRIREAQPHPLRTKSEDSEAFTRILRETIRSYIDVECVVEETADITELIEIPIPRYNCPQ
ncbi:MAG: DUF445 family protein [bacterium]|nr:DUF445 family protein [bacterium]